MFKLTLTPVAIGVATALGRRFGPALGGWVAGIPFTSAPIAIFLTLDRGTAFGTIAAAGILAATASQAAFALGYSVAAARLRWPFALAAGAAGFAAVTIAMNQLQPSPVPALEIVAGSVALALSLMPRGKPAEPVSAPPMTLTMDVVLRAVVATVLVVVITALASRLGPTLAGLLSPLPVFGAVLIVFPHRLQGGDAAISACRGFLWGLLAAVAFGFTLAQLLPRIGLGPAMVASLGAALAVQGATFLVVRRPTLG